MDRELLALRSRRAAPVLVGRQLPMSSSIACGSTFGSDASGTTGADEAAGAWRGPAGSVELGAAGGAADEGDHRARLVHVYHKDRFYFARRRPGIFHRRSSAELPIHVENRRGIVSNQLEFGDNLPAGLFLLTCSVRNHCSSATAANAFSLKAVS